jgi:uncharacterized membrane protein
MKNLIRLTILLLLITFTLSGCYYDKENELYPSVGCGDTTNVTYARSIAPIMVANCNVCHSASNPSGNVITDNYNSLSTIAKDGNLWYAVNWEGAAQTRMPQGATDTISICDRTKIQKWIDAGSPNN